MIVCVCHHVTESQIASHALTGCSSFEELQDELHVATACGACYDCTRSTFGATRGACAGVGTGVHGRLRAPAGGSHAGAAA